MLKIARGFGHKTSGKHRLKYRLDVFVEKVDNLPKPLKKCRIVWSRGPKLQMTDIKDVSNSAAVFKQKLSQIATMYKDPKESFEPKEYKFQLQVPGKDGSDKLITVGKGDLDLSFYVAQEGVGQSKMVPLMCKVGATSTAYLKVVITAEQVTGALDDDDGMTEVSGMTGMTATHLGEEQDLSGFEEPEELQQPIKSPGQGQPAGAASSTKPRASRLSAVPSPTATAIGREAAASTFATASSSTAAPAKPMPPGIEEEADGDVSPINLSPASSTSEPSREAGGRGVGKHSVIADKSKAAMAAGRKLTDAKADLFSSGAPASNSKARTSISRASSGSSKKAPELTEDEARAELFNSSKANTPAARPAKAAAAGKQSKISQPAAANTGLPVVAAVQREGSSSSLASTTSTSTAAGRAGSAASGAPAGRRALLNRSAIKGAAAVESAAASSSSGKAEASSTNQRGDRGLPAPQHSLSDPDDDDAGNENAAAQKASTSGRIAASTTPSKIPGQPTHQPLQPGATRLAGAAGGAEAAATQLLSENEKLRAQLVVLRDQAAAAEEARRLARLAAETAALERDDCQAQVQELQDQLKEVIALADSAGPSGTQEALAASQEQVAELQRQLNEADVGRRALQKECSRLKKQLADEQAERTSLEDHLAQQLEDTGDDMAQETVAAYEAKYNRLKSRYRQLTASHHEEADQLHQEITGLQERNVQLETLTAQLEAERCDARPLGMPSAGECARCYLAAVALSQQPLVHGCGMVLVCCSRSQARHGEVTLAETLQKTGRVSSELAAVRQENQALMQELVGAKLELAQCCEREVIGRRELYKAKETNMKLASKMTKLETLVYNRK